MGDEGVKEEFDSFEEFFEALDYEETMELVDVILKHLTEEEKCVLIGKAIKSIYQCNICDDEEFRRMTNAGNN